MQGRADERAVRDVVVFGAVDIHLAKVVLRDMLQAIAAGEAWIDGLALSTCNKNRSALLHSSR